MKYPRDPYRTTAKFNSTCPCGTAIKKGDPIVYYPNDKKAVCKVCGDKGMADLNNEKYGAW